MIASVSRCPTVTQVKQVLSFRIGQDQWGKQLEGFKSRCLYILLGAEFL